MGIEDNGLEGESLNEPLDIDYREPTEPLEVPCPLKMEWHIYCEGFVCGIHRQTANNPRGCGLHYGKEKKDAMHCYKLDKNMDKFLCKICKYNDKDLEKYCRPEWRGLLFHNYNPEIHGRGKKKVKTRSSVEMSLMNRIDELKAHRKEISDKMVIEKSRNALKHYHVILADIDREIQIILKGAGIEERPVEAQPQQIYEETITSSPIGGMNLKKIWKYGKLIIEPRVWIPILIAIYIIAVATGNA